MIQCSAECAKCGLEASPDQPFGVEIFTADGVLVKQMHIPKAGTLVPQHSHVYDHTSMLATGSVRVWKDGVDLGIKIAPAGILIEAGTMHKFLSLEDGTTIYCVHNLHGNETVRVAAEHQIAGSH